MTRELVERLRKGTGDGLAAWDMMNEAADEIERLTADAEFGHYMADIRKIEIERLKAENARMRAHLGEAFCTSFLEPKP